MSNSMNYETGFKEFKLNNDPNRIIYFIPTDLSIIERFNEARKVIAKAMDEIKTDIPLNSDGEPSDELEEAAEIVKNVNDVIRKQVDYIFDSEVSKLAFGNTSPLSTIRGVPLYERFFNAAQIHIEKELEAEQKASEKRMEKYTAPFVNGKKKNGKKK